MSHETVAIYAPLDRGKVGRMFRNTSAFSTVTPRYQNDVGPEDDGFAEFQTLQEEGREIGRIQTGDVTKDRKIAEFIAGVMNNADEIMMMLAAVHMGPDSITHQPRPDTLDRLILQVATEPGPSSRLDDKLHDALHVDSTFPRSYTGAFEHALWLIKTALPGWGYKVSRGPAPDTTLVATLMRPAVNPDGAITDGSSWGTHYPATGANEALALIHAFLLAIKANPLSAGTK